MHGDGGERGKRWVYGWLKPGEKMGVWMAETGGSDGCIGMWLRLGEKLGVGMAETGGSDGCREG